MATIVKKKLTGNMYSSVYDDKIITTKTDSPTKIYIPTGVADSFYVYELKLKNYNIGKSTGQVANMGNVAMCEVIGSVKINQTLITKKIWVSARLVSNTPATSTQATSTPEQSADNTKTYRQIVDFVIDNMEGGYYHPDMLKDGRIKDNRYGKSGETMFGIDRKYLGNPVNGTAQKNFWQIIDKANARTTWEHNYMGGSLIPQLRTYAAEIIRIAYQKYSKLYLSLEAKKVVDSNQRLLFHFIYSTWNGPGWFQKFSRHINEAVKKGITNSDKLTEIAINSRLNSGESLVIQGGNKIANIINQLNEYVNDVDKSGVKTIITLVSIGAIIFIAKRFL